MPFAASLSEHPDPAQAIGECIGDVLDRHGPHPDLLLLFATAAHRDDLAELSRVAQRLLAPGCLVAAVSSSVIGGAREVEEQPGVSLWAAWDLGPVAAVHLDHGPGGALLGTTAGGDGWDRFDALTAAGAGRTALVLAEPLSFPVDEFLARVEVTRPELVVVGGLLAPPARPGEPVFVVDGVRHARGAVAIVLEQAVRTVVSQGCRPVGAPFTVTRAEGNVLGELGSRPALARLQELATEAAPGDRELLLRGVHLGRVIDEHAIDFRRGDFLVRAVLGARAETGALVVGDRVQVGDTVQFQVRDADSAHEDLVELLAGERADAALVFTCNGRGRHLFDTDDHDAELVCELTGARSVAGVFCAGEVGPVGSRSFLHGFTASVALFTDRSAP
ncbi:MAG: FIST N-terminal domain-containing protein [Acidimicrobiia bacterium]